MKGKVNTKTGKQAKTQKLAATEALKEYPKKHEFIRLKDDGEYGSETDTDWEWCRNCGALQKVGVNYGTLKPHFNALCEPTNYVRYM